MPRADCLLSGRPRKPKCLYQRTTSVLVHFISCEPAAAEIQTLLHQPHHLIQSFFTGFRVLGSARGNQPGHSSPVARNRDFLSLFGFSKKTRELLIGFPSSDRAHILSLQQCHYSSTSRRPSQ